MAGGIEWFRWHHGSVSDPKFQLVARKASASVAEVLAMWACLLESASQATPRGYVIAPDFEALECALGLPDGQAQAIYGRMEERGLVGADGAITAWQRRQPKRERDDDNSTERVKAFRDRQRHETPRNASGGTETPRGEESREEGSVPDGTGASAPAPLEQRPPGVSGLLPPAPPPQGLGGSTEPDAIFGDGLAYLVRCGVPERGARSFLGKMRKELGDDLIAVELLVKAQQEEVSDPIPWLRAAAKRRIAAGRTSAGVAL